jgi:tetratricopeptide (TPR) repeat protein
MVMAAERLNPLPPPWYVNGRAAVEYGLRHYAAAAQLLEGLGNDTFYWDHCYLAACYARLGKPQEAQHEIAKALRLKPNLTVKWMAVAEPYAKAADLEHLLEPLREAGLPE